ncbi:MAG: hypothetical protein NC111_03000 [Bacteroides sp.]|nr:hypothetical protein [Bacteroides sp.]MCM1412818.1 hypothetical protein [Bacteroides sp.]MCM1471487.1 hypothetical protein [Bacteroides sp.]
MKSILSTDIVFATLRQRGRVIGSLRLSGVTSLADVMNHVKGLAIGLVTLELRNGTQGWSHNHNLMMAA